MYKWQICSLNLLSFNFYIASFDKLKFFVFMYSDMPVFSL